MNIITLPKRMVLEPQIIQLFWHNNLYIYIIVGTRFEAQTQYVKRYRPSEPSTINL